MNKRPKVLVLGGSGMLGSVVAHYLYNSKDLEIRVTTREPLDDNEYFLSFSSPIQEAFIQLQYIISEFKPDYIINCIGAIPQNQSLKSEDFFLLNYELPFYLHQATKKYNTIIIQPSTDCIFDGKKKHADRANLSSTKDFLEETGRDLATYDFRVSNDPYRDSKRLLEWGVATKPDYYDRMIVLRGSLIGPNIRKASHGLFDFVRGRKNQQIDGYTNHFWNGNTTLEFAEICEDIILSPHDSFKGIVSLGNMRVLSKFELIRLINDAFHFNVDLHGVKTVQDVDRTINCNNVIQTDFVDHQIRRLSHWIKEQKIKL